MSLEQQIETLQKWACDKAELDCWKCEYSCGSDCPFDEVIEAAEDMAREGKNVIEGKPEPYKGKPEPYKCPDCIEFPCARKECDKNHEAKECKYFDLW